MDTKPYRSDVTSSLFTQIRLKSGSTAKLAEPTRGKCDHHFRHHKVEQTPDRHQPFIPAKNLISKPFSTDSTSSLFQVIKLKDVLPAESIPIRDQCRQSSQHDKVSKRPHKHANPIPEKKQTSTHCPHTSGSLLESRPQTSFSTNKHHSEVPQHAHHSVRKERHSQYKPLRNITAQVSARIKLTTTTKGVSSQAQLNYLSPVFRLKPPRGHGHRYFIKALTQENVQEHTNFSEIAQKKRIASAQCDYLQVLIFNAQESASIVQSYQPIGSKKVNVYTSERALYPTTVVKLLEIERVASADERIAAYLAQTDSKTVKKELKNQQEIKQTKALARLGRHTGFGMEKSELLKPSQEIMDGGSTTSPDSV